MKPVPGYKTAEELGITDEERDGLSLVVTELLQMADDDFSMRNWQTCICGVLKKYVEPGKFRSEKLQGLFVPPSPTPAYWSHCSPWDSKPKDAAIAVTNFLMHGA